MRNVTWLLLSILSLSLIALAQAKPGVQDSVGGRGSHKSYTLPAGVTAGEPGVNRGSNPEVWLQEVGTVPAEAKYCCYVPCGEGEGGSVGVLLQHFSSKKDLDDQMQALKLSGDFKTMEEMGYQSVEVAGPQAISGATEAVRNKGPLSFEDIDGGQASFYEKTVSCMGVEMKLAHDATTVSNYHVQWAQNNTLLDITMDLRVSNGHDRAKKYAHEVIEKVKNLDYKQVK